MYHRFDIQHYFELVVGGPNNYENYASATIKKRYAEGRLLCLQHENSATETTDPCRELWPFF